MRAKSGYLMREIADTGIIVPIGERTIDFKGMISLNEVGVFLWKLLENETSYDDLLRAVLEEYDIGEEAARTDLDAFLKEARGLGVIEE